MRIFGNVPEFNRRSAARKALGLEPLMRHENWANVGRNHPNYGMTAQEHASTKEHVHE